MKLIRLLDGAVDLLLAAVLTCVLLVGVYFTYDTAWVFYHASAGRVAAYRPQAGTETEAQTPISEDYTAWLSMEGTGIDYPIMQGEDNNKYLNLDPYGNFSLAGSVFLDFRNARDYSDSYSLVYAHHMSGGLMFGALDAYYDENYFRQHRVGTLVTPDRRYALELFALMEIDGRDSVFFAPHGSEQVLALASVNSKYYEAPANDHVLALTTCVDDRSSLRTVVLLTMTEVGA